MIPPHLGDQVKACVRDRTDSRQLAIAEAFYDAATRMSSEGRTSEELVNVVVEGLAAQGIALTCEECVQVGELVIEAIDATGKTLRPL